jgi:hypothetical protein
MFHPALMPNIKYAVRNVTAFVAHSFAPEDERIVRRLIEFFSKLGVHCESGKKAEADSVNEKIRRRLRDADFFIGIFTRRGSASEDGSYQTAPKVVEEKTIALSENKKMLLFVEEGVKDVGGMQGDHEYIRFNRDNFGDALIDAIDYVLSITSVKLEMRADDKGIHITLPDGGSPEQQIAKLRKMIESRPDDLALRLGLAGFLKQVGDNPATLEVLEQADARFRRNPEVTHQMGHYFEDSGDLKKAESYFEKSINLNSAAGKYYACFGRVLLERSRHITKGDRKKPMLEKAKRFLERGQQLAPDLNQMFADLIFRVNEEMRSTVEEGPSPGQVG